MRLNSRRAFSLFRFFFVLSLFVAIAISTFGAADESRGQVCDKPAGKIYTEVTGSGTGTPLIAANGGPGFDHTYLQIATTAWTSLGQKRRVIFYDQRGGGRSEPLEVGPSWKPADQIDDLEALRAHLGYEKIDLLGHSWGGFLSMAYAARHPERIAHLILVDSAAPKWSDTVFLFTQVFPQTTERQEALAFADELGDKAASDASIHEYLTMLFYSPEKRDVFVAQMGPGAYNKKVNQVLNTDIGRFDLNPEIRKFRFPVMVGTGQFDMNVAPVVAYKIHQAIAGSRFVVFQRSGHLPFYEEPEAFDRAVEDFLQSQ